MSRVEAEFKMNSEIRNNASESMDSGANSYSGMLDHSTMLRSRYTTYPLSPVQRLNSCRILRFRVGETVRQFVKINLQTGSVDNLTDDKLVPSPFHPPNPVPSSVEVGAFNGRSCHPSSGHPCGRAGSGFTVRHGLYGHPKPLYRHHCEGCKSGGDRDRRLRFRARRTRRKKGACWRCRWNGHCCSRGECPELAVGRIAPSEPPSTRT